MSGDKNSPKVLNKFLQEAKRPGECKNAEVILLFKKDNSYIWQNFCEKANMSFLSSTNVIQL